MAVSRRTLAAGAAALFVANEARAQQTGTMSTAPDPTALPIPAQNVPAPRSVSAEAKAFWEAAARRIAAQHAGAPPAPGAAPGADYFRSIAQGFDGASETIALPSGANLYRITPNGRDRRLARAAYVDIHGGGFVSGGGEQSRFLAMARARNYGVEVYAIDYRLLPDHPYPAGLDDCVDAYRIILRHHRADAIVVGGSSAGGNLAAALMLRAKAEGLSVPKALMLLTPAVDMTFSGDSHQTNRYLDVAIGRGDRPEPDPRSGYGGNVDPADPLVSPLFGDLSGFPPTLLTTGTRDLLLSDTVRMHRALRRAGVPADLLVTEGGCHIGFGGMAPEDREVLGECRKFLRGALGVED